MIDKSCRQASSQSSQVLTGTGKISRPTSMSTSLSAFEGVSYLPNQGAFQSSLSINDLEGHGIRSVRIQWVDLVNNIRCRIVPLAYFKKLVGLSRPGISITRVTLGIVFLSIPEGFRQAFETNLNVHGINNNHISACHSVRPNNGSMLLIYLRLGCVHMLLDMPV